MAESDCKGALKVKLLPNTFLTALHLFPFLSEVYLKPFSLIKM